ncbi:MAG: aspartate kinase [Anaerolineae bacterium]|nr:aspartate kinase [Anaerolineae bacterium]
MIVMKFGGTSVGDAGRMSAVMDIIESYLSREPVIVVSAMSGVTNLLIEAARAASRGEDRVYREAKATLLERHLQVVDQLLARSVERVEVAGLIEDRLHDFELLCRSIAVLGEITPRGYDAVSSIGEQLSARILAAALSARGIRARDIVATQLIITDDHFGAARPIMDLTRERVQALIPPLLERGIVPVVTGYVGATKEGVTTVLGRGGSDYSAAILGACLGAEEVQIWTDVDGILTADPNIVPEAHTLDELSYEEAEELAYYGADVLHPKTVAPVHQAGIPLRILNSFNPSHPGTLITSSPSPNRRAMPAIISTKGLSLIGIAGNSQEWGPLVGARVLESLADAGVDILLFTQPLSERSLNLVVRRQDQRHCVRVLEHALSGELQRGVISHIGVREEVGTISVVGRTSAQPAQTVPRAFAALGRRGTRIISVAQSASEYNISFVVPEADVDDTVRYIHAELGLDTAGGL